MLKINFLDGSVAQLVEQWTENPCVAGSIPARATSEKIDISFCKNITIVFFTFIINNMIISIKIR